MDMNGKDTASHCIFFMTAYDTDITLDTLDRIWCTYVRAVRSIAATQRLDDNDESWIPRAS